MLPPSQRSYIDLQQADVRSRIVDSSDDNKILEQFLREGKADQVLMNEHVD